MKLSAGLLAVCLLAVSNVFAAANCQHSQSWQCQGHQSQSGQNSQTSSGIGSGGQTPDQGQTNPHLGSTPTGSVPMMTLQPATVIVAPPNPSIQAPAITPVVAPPQPQVAVPKLPPTTVVAPPRAQVAVPPQPQIAAPSIQVNPVNTPVLTGYGKVPPQQFYVVPPKVISGHSAIPPKPVVKIPPMQTQPALQPYAIPPKTQSVPGKIPVPQVVMAPPGAKTPPKAPPRQVYPNPQPIVVGYGKLPVQQVPPGTTQTVSGQGQPAASQTGTAVGQLPTASTTHLLVNNQAGQIRMGMQIAKSDFGNEIVEPGIMNSQVTLYRSHDVQEIAFKDSIPMDVTGFHLVFAGIKEPIFASPAVEPEQDLLGSNDDTFMFFFDYASAVVPPKQVKLYKDIVEKYKATGKRLIVTSETDGFGSSEYNTALASHRAETIVTELINRGVKAKDIDTHLRVRYGRSDPSSQDAHRLSTLERVAWVHFE